MITQLLALVRGVALAMLFVSAGMAANNWYIATNGTSTGVGSREQPYDLTTALSGSVGKPGDVFWLNDGTYQLGHVDTKIQGAPGQPITFRPQPGTTARVDGSLTFFESAGYVVLRELEFYSSNTNRVSAQTKVGFHPTDIKRIHGISSYVPNMSFINLVVHDETGEGIYVSREGENNLIYGCVVYNNGWRSPDNAEGHGIYVQGNLGTREISDNILFNNAGAGLHVYDDDPNTRLGGITMDGNVAFNSGAIQRVRHYRDWIVGVDRPAISTDRIVFQNNMGYPPQTAGQDDVAQLGRQGLNGCVAILNNYLPQGLEVNNWNSATVTGNVVGASSKVDVVHLTQSQPSLTGTWDRNTYILGIGGSGFRSNSTALSFSTWKKVTGFDSDSTCQTGALTGTKIFVRPNRFVPGRANLIVYNWDRQSSISVDVSRVLAPDTPFEVRNAADLSGQPVASGIYHGQPLVLPMNGLTVAAPNGRMLTPPPTGPAFNVYVLIPHLVSQQFQATNEQAHLSRPAESGD
jgi:parallel beta-helix repeat protein